MLIKLLKHEFRATGRVMLPLYFILLLLSLGVNFSSRWLMNSKISALSIIGALTLVAFIVAVIGVCVMSLAMMIQRFQKNLLSDEGYIMFTLPVSIHEHIWAKLIVSSVWFFATVLAIIISIGILAYDVHFLHEFIDSIRYLTRTVTLPDAMNSLMFCLEFLILVFAACMAFSLQFYAALAVGHSFPNHKMALSVAAFCIFQFISQFAVSMLFIGLDNLSVAFPFNFDFQLSGWAAMHAILLILTCAAILYGAVFYVITAITLKKRLNLE